jgi:hypothetical protein
VTAPDRRNFAQLVLAAALPLPAGAAAPARTPPGTYADETLTVINDRVAAFLGAHRLSAAGR